MPDYRIRPATPSDAPIVADHRVKMFSEMGELLARDVPTVQAASEARAAEDLASGAYLAWFVEYEHEIVAGAGMLLHDYYPNAKNPLGLPTAYVLNVYTEPSHRHVGLARRLVLEIFGWCTAHGVSRVSLHASPAGRSIYEKLGFQSTNEMRVDL
jgi:GNAT superfamily N-acetyltransferase